MELHYAKVTSKGQVTIPVALRKRLEIEDGSTVLFLVKTDGEVQLTHPAQDIKAVIGSVEFPPGTTIERLDDLARIIGPAEAVARHRRSMGEDIDVDEFVRQAVARESATVVG